jgi:hypothetical protein
MSWGKATTTSEVKRSRTHRESLSFLVQVGRVYTGVLRGLYSKLHFYLIVLTKLLGAKAKTEVSVS